MAQARELRRRIRSVQSTRQITKTMEMVATSKLKRAQDRVVGARPYAQALTQVIADLYAPDRAERFPLLRQPGAAGGKIRRVAVLLCTANRGLCGAFNANLIREARRRIADLEAQGAQVDLHLVGKKGVGFFKYSKRPIASQRVDIGDRPTAEHAQELIAPLIAQFESGALDAVDVVYARFNSAIATPPTVQRVLPVEPVRRSGGQAVESGAATTARPADRPSVDRPTADYILKPSADAILEQLLPLYVRNQIYRALVETAAGF